jgi:hypothetical protein
MFIKILISTMILAMVSTASAQMWSNPPKVLTITDNATGEKIGTATISGDRVYMRNRHGELYATVIREQDGTRKWFDPNGKPIDPATTVLPLE